MAYIGTKPTVGNFQICDAISVVNGQAAYTMQVGSVNVIPQSANHMIVSLNGTIQKPNSSYTVSGSTITFASNLATGDVIDFIQILGDVLDLGVPSDATVTTAKLADSSVSLAKLTATGTKDATTFLRGDNSFAVPSGGNTVAISHVQDTTDYSQSNQGETVFGSGLSFTPASTTSQVMAIIEAHIGVRNDGSDDDARTLFRFYSTNSSGNSIKELDSFAEFGHINMQASLHEMYGYVTSTISNCQRDSSNNVVIKLTAVSNQDSGTTVYLYNHRAVFLEIG